MSYCHGHCSNGFFLAISQVMSYLEEYYAAMDLVQTPSALATQVLSWIPPAATGFIINVDEATFLEQGAVGIAVIVKDAQGRVTAALSKKVLAPLGAIDTEAKALEVGVQFAKDIGTQDFILESDSLVLYHVVTGLA